MSVLDKRQQINKSHVKSIKQEIKEHSLFKVIFIYKKKFFTLKNMPILLSVPFSNLTEV